MNDQKKKYLMAKVATQLFQLNPEYLSAMQRAEVEEKVHRMARIQDLILASGEATRVAPVQETEIEQALKECVSQFPSEEEFNHAVTTQSLSTAGMKQALQDQLMCDKILESVVAEVPPLEKDKAVQYYRQHQQEFFRPACWEMSQILLTINDDYAENTRQNALARITRIRNQADVKSFGKLARRHSECPSAMNDGYLGWCKEGVLYQAVSDTLHQLHPHQISQPVETEIGFHLVTYQQKHEAGQASFEEAWPFLQEKHNSRAKAYLQRQWIGQLLSREAEVV